MDWNAPMNALWNYFNSPKDDSTSTPPSPPAGMQGTSGGGMMSGYSPAPSTVKISPYNFRSTITGKPIADKPQPDEVTMDVYPTIHSLEPTKLNSGKPWAAQKVPTGFIDGLAYAEAKARDVGGFDPETLKQFLPLATRESRYLDYGNNGVNVDYQTPPPKSLQPSIIEANRLRAEEKRLNDLALDAFHNKKMTAFSDIALKQTQIKKQREALDEKILSDPNWTSRSSKYQDITNKAQQLGLKQSSNQELIRDKNGMIVSKADVYRAKDTDPYAVKALHIPLALYNKQIAENPEAKGLELTKRFVGGGKEAEVRNAQEAHIAENIYNHPKNKPALDYYNARVQHHSFNINKRPF